MASKVGIINYALRILGADPIAAPDEDTENARKVDNIYDITLKSMLRSHPWSFAKKETALSQVSETPVLDDYTYVYSLPSDYLRLNKTSVEPDYSHKIKGRRIYSNSSTLSIEYIYFCTDTEQYDAEFVDAFAARLAAELCYAITKNKSLVEVKWAEFKEKFNKAKNLNAQEITPDESQNDLWLQSRL
jgi:hypothetical protein